LQLGSGFLAIARLMDHEAMSRKVVSHFFTESIIIINYEDVRLIGSQFVFRHVVDDIIVMTV